MNEVFWCGLKRKPLNREYMELHHCKRRQKGKNRGKRCRFLLKVIA